MLACIDKLNRVLMEKLIVIQFGYDRRVRRIRGSAFSTILVSAGIKQYMYYFISPA